MHAADVSVDDIKDAVGQGADEQWISRAEACAIFGVATWTWTILVREGRVPRGRPGHTPSGSSCRLYPLNELNRLKAQWDQEKEQSEQQLEPYLDPDRPGVWRVPVVSGKHPGMEAIVDANDVPLVRGKRWNWSPGRAESTSERGNGGSVVWSRHGGASMPRVILDMLGDREHLVSHVNGDRLDCRRANLIVRTRSELKRASRPPKKWEVFRPYPDPDRPGVWRVPVRSNKQAMEALIDAADLPVVEGKGWNWSPRSDGAVAGTVVLATAGRQEPLHRMILGLTDPQIRVTFANADPLDCRRENLSVRTQAEIIHATRKVETRAGQACSSRYKGVAHDVRRGKWLAQIRRDRVHKYLGRFNSEEKAAEAYDAAARVIFGDHAHVNFPDRPSSQQAMAKARRAMDDAVSQKRANRLRQRELEQNLRQSEAEAVATDRRGSEQGTPLLGLDRTAMLSSETARQLFDVTPTIWTRWQRFGWLPAPESEMEGEPMYPIALIERLLRRCGIIALPYPDPRKPGVYRVPLAGEKADGREALIDDDAVSLIQGRRWRFSPRHVGCGGEVQTMNPAENIRLHHVVMGFIGDIGDAVHIGHRNDNPFDCRRTNLVVRTLTDTAANKRKQATFRGRPCTSRFKGVSWDRRRERWTAKIKKDRVTQHLGTFRDETAAAQAYDEAARALFGEHARPNFPDGVDVRLERMAA